ncbi:MAG TPA: DNA primase small subunit domain-containing protein [Kofleriaceae bacterium]|jgi:DNA ligase D-like protein (predicted polymerase)|nr:DNA primase small subunit domain-containing protein [Kofleriaceae bacterium]
MRLVVGSCKDSGVPKPPQEVLTLGGFDVGISNPDKIYFPDAGITKLELVHYYASVSAGALRGVAGRPMVLKRYVDGAAGEPFYQKRAPAKRPPFVGIATFRFPSGRHADECVVDNAAALAWVVNLGCIELHPHAVRAIDMDRPDELRIDLDPVPGVAWSQILDVAKVANEFLGELGLVGWPKTSGSRGVHVWVRIAPEWPFQTVRRAALAFAREIERRAPSIATAKWWKEERRGVFLDYNQNARDRTTCSAYSVRATPDARVSMPLTWSELLVCDPREFTLRTVPAIYAANGDRHAAIDDHPGRIEALLELADKQERDGHADAPWPPHYKKAAGEAPRVAPSRARTPKVPVLTIAQAKHKPDALAGLERWKARHPEVAALLAPEDVIVDTNRGRATAWYRIRINLKNVPAEIHPAAEPLDPDYDPKSEWLG